MKKEKKDRTTFISCAKKEKSISTLQSIFFFPISLVTYTRRYTHFNKKIWNGK